METFNRNLRLSTNEYLFIQSVNYIHISEKRKGTRKMILYLWKTQDKNTIEYTTDTAIKILKDETNLINIART